MPLPFPLSHQFGTLAGGLGCFPFDYEAYPPQSHSREARHGIRSLVGLGTGRPRATSRPIQTRFPYASGRFGLKLATRGNSPAHSSIGTPSGIPIPCGIGIALRLIVGTRFQVLFHSPSGVLFTFPSRYLCAIGRQGCLALERGRPGFPRDSSCPVVLGNAAQEDRPLLPTGLSPCVACRSRAVRLTRGLLTSRPGLSPVQRRPTTPRGPRPRATPP